MSEENKNPQASVATKLLSLLDHNVADFEKAVRGAEPALSADQLTFLRIGEEQGQNRKGILLAIDGAQERLVRAAADAAAEAERKTREEAEARLLKFGVTGPVAEGADAVAAATTGPSFLVLGDGTREIDAISRIEARPEQFSTSAGRAMYGRPIRVEGVDVKTAVHAVALVDGDNAVHAVCEIPGGVMLGGRTVELPAGSLIFG